MLSTHEAQDLYMYTVNTANIYRGIARDTIRNLARKMVKGEFDREKAKRAFYHVAEAGARSYGVQFCHGADHRAKERNGLKTFSVSDRREVAGAMLDHYAGEITEQAEALIGPGQVQVTAYDWGRDVNGNPTAHYDVDGRRATSRRVQCGCSDGRMDGRFKAMEKAGINPRWYEMAERPDTKRPDAMTALYRRKPITLD